ncbi:hypothetical protein I4U23_027485 [Adineta vaga]|nr:hypothetical protein I4U23_027485 [Adineta vaga]
MNRIDHIVINTRDCIDEAVAFFERIGFTVTPRGYHTVGSINNLIVFKTDYLELFGYPGGKPLEQLSQFLQQPAGLAAIALKVDNPEQVRDKLITRELTPSPIFNVSRPLDLGNDKMADVQFRVLTLEPNPLPGSYMIYCQHVTPELVWRSVWQTHSNGCIGMTRLSINVNDPMVASELYLRAMDAVKLENTEANTCIIRLPNFEITLVHEIGKPLGMFKLVFGTDSFEKLTFALTKGGINYDKEGERIVVDSLSYISCALEFECITIS